MKLPIAQYSRPYLVLVGGLILGFGAFTLTGYFLTETSPAIEDNAAWESEDAVSADSQPVVVIRSIDRAKDIESPPPPKQTSFITSFPIPSQTVVGGFHSIQQPGNPPHAPPSNQQAG
ncbi:MAG: hypothetical protein GX444_03495 [Myxococcales bacterium]|nr:hypothetical protein [Myxococcales bacterium]